jgi:curved DNA-binding protein CbpA
MDSFTDYYSVLGVSSDASAEVIKAAFKKLALQYHPDLYKGPDAEERMRDLLAAYQTLSDHEKRRLFDARRSEHVYDSFSPHLSAQSSEGGQTSTRVHPETSARSRGTQQHKYAFPTITLGNPITINLVDCQYTLSSERAQTLLKLGMLRGIFSTPQQGFYRCHRCHHRWNVSTRTGNDRPRSCPKCQAFDWDEYLLLRCQHCAAIFESEQIRYEIGTHNYGLSQKENSKGNSADHLCPPYELFPLCPQCIRSHWCPAEDQRVETLRAEAARRAAISRALWFLAAIAAILILVILAFSFHL